MARDEPAYVAAPALVMGSARGFEAEGPDLWDRAPQNPLSAESRRIISRLPSGLDKPQRAARPAPFSIDRSDPQISELFPEEGYIAGNPVGISIEVKRPRLDVNYELEKAYNVLIAGQRDAAIEIYRTVLRNDPNNKLALFGLATTYHRGGQLGLARPLYGKLLVIDPENREALNNFLALIGEEAPEEALRQLQALRSRNPDFSPIPAQMAVIYDRMGRGTLAAAAMREALRLSPENLSYRYNLAVMLDKMGNRSAAAAVYRELIAAHERGEILPGDVAKIQERLTIIGSTVP